MIYAALVAIAAGLALALHQTRARLRWERREHAVTRAQLRDNHRAMESCACGVARAWAAGTLPSRDEARGRVLAALVVDPRAPWCTVIIDARGSWSPVVRVVPGGVRPLPLVTRWGDA